MLHLNELVRTSFISATASVDQLKLAGYEALRVRPHVPGSAYGWCSDHITVTKVVYEIVKPL